MFKSNRPEPVLWTKDGGELPDPDRMVVSGRELNILSSTKRIMVHIDVKPQTPLAKAVQSTFSLFMVSTFLTSLYMQE